MKLFARCSGVTALALLTASPVLAQGTISYNAIQFARNAGCWTFAPSANLSGVSAPLTDDHLYEFGWWYRVAGDGQETVFPVPDTQQYLGGYSSHLWNDVGGRGLFSAEEVAILIESNIVSPGGGVTASLTLHNLSVTNPLTLHIFNLADLDLQPTSGDDSARLVEWTPNRILEIGDPSGNFAQYTAYRNSAITNHYLIRPYGATDVAAMLSNGTATDFDDSGVPFGPGDITAGWQFTLTLPPGGDRPVTVSLNVNMGIACYDGWGVFCDGLERGNTSVWSEAVP